MFSKDTVRKLGEKDKKELAELWEDFNLLPHHFGMNWEIKIIKKQSASGE